MGTTAIRKSVLDVYSNGSLITAFTYEGGVVSGTALAAPLVLTREEAGIQLGLFSTFGAEIVRLYNPTSVVNLVLGEHELSTPSGQLKLKIKVGGPTPFINTITYDSTTKMITISSRGNFEVTFDQWHYWLDAIREFGRLIGRFE